MPRRSYPHPPAHALSEKKLCLQDGTCAGVDDDKDSRAPCAQLAPHARMQEDPVYRSFRCLVGVGVGCGMIGREAGWTLERVFVLSYVRGLFCLLRTLRACIEGGVYRGREEWLGHHVIVLWGGGGCKRH